MENREGAGTSAAKNKQLEFLVKAKEQHRIHLMVKANVIGMGVGQRTRNGEVVDELVLKVYVSNKLPKALLDKKDLIPTTLELDNKKVPVDVEQSDVPQAQIFDLRSRPLIGGSSIGPANLFRGVFSVGTLGVCVTLDDRRTYILSNNHVLSLANQLAIGTNIVQPSMVDGGVAPTTTSVNDLVATLSNFIPIDFGTFTITIFGITYTLPRVNYVDCALAIVRDAFNAANREIHWVGYPATSTVDPTQFSFFGLNLIFPSQVCKMGRTTEYTVGNIVDISWDGYIDYSQNFGNVNGTNRAWFQDQLKIDGGRRPFSMPGDSGSLVMSLSDSRPAGLLFAGAGNFSYCNYISAVMRALSIPRI
jgi:hypothetical protein